MHACLVYGGAACGKSEIAERLCLQMARELPAESQSDRTPGLLYVATMIDDGSSYARKHIERHRALRKEKGFYLLEAPQAIDRVLLESEHRRYLNQTIVLLEGLGTLVANEMFSVSPARDVDVVVDGIERQILAVMRTVQGMVVVSDDCMRGCDNYDKGTCAYLKALGKINQRIAGICDGVVEVVCGIPIWHKGAMYER